MKGLSRKQVIVPISKDNKKNFMEESNTHVSNMNKALKNIKSNILVNFIYSNVASIIIITYKVTISLDFVTNFIQLVSPQPVDRFSQTKLRWKAPNEGYPHICGMYKSSNKRLRYQDISSCKSFVC